MLILTPRSLFVTCLSYQVKEIDATGSLKIFRHEKTRLAAGSLEGSLLGSLNPDNPNAVVPELGDRVLLHVDVDVLVEALLVVLEGLGDGLAVLLDEDQLCGHFELLRCFVFPYMTTISHLERTCNKFS